MYLIIAAWASHSILQEQNLFVHSNGQYTNNTNFRVANIIDYGFL